MHRSIIAALILRARTETNNKLHPHLMLNPGFKTRMHKFGGRESKDSHPFLPYTPLAQILLTEVSSFVVLRRWACVCVFLLCILYM